MQRYLERLGIAYTEQGAKLLVTALAAQCRPHLEALQQTRPQSR